MFRHNKKQAIIFVIIWLALITAIIIASLTPEMAPTDKYNIDKILHFSTYAFLAIFPMLLFKGKLKIAIVELLLFAIAVAIEVAQSYIPERYGSYGDTIANGLGVLFGMILGYAILCITKKIKK